MIIFDVATEGGRGGAGAGVEAGPEREPLILESCYHNQTEMCFVMSDIPPTNVREMPFFLSL